MTPPPPVLRQWSNEEDEERQEIPPNVLFIMVAAATHRTQGDSLRCHSSKGLEMTGMCYAGLVSEQAATVAPYPHWVACCRGLRMKLATLKATAAVWGKLCGRHAERLENCND